MNSCFFEYATVFPIKNKFWPVFLAFYFDLVPPFYFLKWNRFFSTFIPVLSKSHHYLKYLLSREVCINLQIKKILASETLTHNLNLRGFSIPK